MGDLTVDIVVGIQYGDEGKGKVTHRLCEEGNYTYVLRYNGGCNAGHTIFHERQKFVTHHIPAGVFFDIPSIIGPGCVVHPETFFEELAELKSNGIDTEGLIYVANNAHVITDEHRVEDSGADDIGTTGSGNGPAYRDKHARVGARAEDAPELQPFLVDIYDVLHQERDVTVLGEGAQGFGLDIDWGRYPYVTSSHCTVAGALTNGIPYTAVRNVWGVGKVYETYVGARDFEPDDSVFDEIRQVGGEFGATTGRPRQCRWLRWSMLERAIRMNGVNRVVLNKVDILEEVGEFALVFEGEKWKFHSWAEMKGWLTARLEKIGLNAENIYFSGDPEKI